MGARTLEARLTRRLLALAGGVLIAVGVAGVMVTERVLGATDTATARASAAAARDAFARELQEGDPAAEALDEVIAASDAQGMALTVRQSGQVARSSGPALPDLHPGGCATVEDRGLPWRACAVAGEATMVVIAAIPLAAHRTAVAALERGMVAVVVVAMFALWLLVRRALGGPIAELTALVGWTTRILDTEEAVTPPVALTREIAQLEVAFDILVRRLLGALVRERANSAHIAHELRTPLTAIVGELENLDLKDDASREAVARVRFDVARLADVIEAILVLSEPWHGARSEAVINIADLTRDLVPPGTPVNAPDEALVEGEEQLVALALRNLLDNARKYGGGVKLVNVSRDGGFVRVSVLDGGPGVDDAARAKMFERYWRGSADGEGRGLGLALVRAVAERHGGRVDATRGPDGQGLDVSITLDRLVGWHQRAAGSGAG